MDNMIESSELYDYRPPISENFDEVGSEFTISVHNEDIVTLPSRSLLVISGTISVNKEVTAATATSAATTQTVAELPLDDVHFVNNGPLYLFDRIDYYIGDAKIDTIRKPGYATQMKGLVSFENDVRFNNAGWKISSKNHSNILSKNGYFTATIPLSLIMGFFEDHKNFVYRMPQKLVFYRCTGPPNNSLYINPTKKINLDKFVIKEVIWRMPQMKLSIPVEAKVRQEILQNKNYPIQYRHWYYHSIIPSSGTEFTWDMSANQSRVMFILISLQKKSKDNNIQADNSEYDLSDLENVQVLLNNNTFYPRERLNLKFSEYKCGNAYHMYNNFKSSYYDKNPDETNPLIDYETFLTKYPVIVIDCSHQPDVIKNSFINVKIMFSWRNNLAESTIIHCVMIMNRNGTYNPLNNRVIAQL